MSAGVAISHKIEIIPINITQFGLAHFGGYDQTMSRRLNIKVWSYILPELDNFEEATSEGINVGVTVSAGAPAGPGKRMSIVSNTSADNVNNANAVFASFLAKHGTAAAANSLAKAEEPSEDPDAIEAVEDNQEVEEEVEEEEEEEV